MQSSTSASSHSTSRERRGVVRSLMRRDEEISSDDRLSGEKRRDTLEQRQREAGTAPTQCDPATTRTDRRRRGEEERPVAIDTDGMKR